MNGLPRFRPAQTLFTSTRGGKGMGTGWARHGYNGHSTSMQLYLAACHTIETLSYLQSSYSRLPANYTRSQVLFGAFELIYF